MLSPLVSTWTSNDSITRGSSCLAFFSRFLLLEGLGALTGGPFFFGGDGSGRS